MSTGGGGGDVASNAPDGADATPGSGDGGNNNNSTAAAAASSSLAALAPRPPRSPPRPTQKSELDASLEVAAANASKGLPPILPRPADAASGRGGHRAPTATGRGVPGRGGGAAGRGRGGKRRGPGRPPKSERQGPPASSALHSHSPSSSHLTPGSPFPSAAPTATTSSNAKVSRGPGRPAGRGRSQIRRGPGRPPGPGKRKRMELAAIVAAASDPGAATIPSSSIAVTTADVVKTKRKYTKRKQQQAHDDDHDNIHNDDYEYTEQSYASSVTASPRHAISAGAGYETDPETTLDVQQGKVSTIHWDPSEGCKIGWKARLLSTTAVRDGRITAYDPYTHKHKIQLDDEGDEDIFEEYTASQQQNKKRKNKKETSVWLRLPHSDVQVATRLVWAHVKGYAWWPAMVMELSSPATSTMTPPRPGFVFVHFIGAPEHSFLRDAPDCIRSFSSLVKDPVIEKSKKKRNAKAIAQAQREELNLQHYKNQAARHYALKAFFMADSATKYVGKRVRLFSSDINYPDGATVIGIVRQYSSIQKKWLVSFEIAHKLKHKMSAAWINLQSKDCSMTFLQDTSDKPRKKNEEVEPTDIDLVPFLFGFSFKITERTELPQKKKSGKGTEKEESKKDVSQHDKDDVELQLEADARLAKVLKENCRACLDVWSGDFTVTCADCGGSYHLGCLDPPLSKEAYKRMERDLNGNVVDWKCSRCTLCLGCYQKDIVFGSHPMQVPPTVSFPHGETLNLCSMCVKAYEADKYCPNCAHSWDDIKYQKVLDQLDEDGVGPPQEPVPAKKQRRKSNDSSGGLDTGAADASDAMTATAKGMPPGTPFASGTLMNGARIDPSWYHAENNVWGYTEGDMLVCDSCDLWVHAGCGGLNHEEYELTSEGNHPIYSKEFLCRVCCRKRCVDLIERMEREDLMMLFAVPVTEKVAPNYSDVIKRPMDLQTMMTKAKGEEYLNYAWVREDFALMVFNALTFNRFYTNFWNEAKRFYEQCIKVVFSEKMLGKAAPPCKYDEAVENNFIAAESARQMEEDRVQQDESAEKKDLVMGAVVEKVTLPPLREKAPDESSCLPFQEVKVRPLDAFYVAWMDCCFTCGSTGASDTMIFCVDCGEAFHSFCANVPIHSMDAYSVAGWRCPNCKVCEISGDVPIDELRMLFCEMCDRAFSLDLLDPPLEKAPSGLWICGQCVDCKVCKNTSEPPRPAAKANSATSAISLKYWSRDPEKCYRCGGCDGLSDLIVGDKLECQVCKKILRNDDGDFINCSECKVCVHAGCDRRADDFMKISRTEELFGSRTLKAQQKTKPKYRCPPCSGVELVTKLDFTTFDTCNKAHMHDQAWQRIADGSLHCDNLSPIELHGRLMDQLEWQTREMWRDEYVSVVEEAIRFYGLAKSSFGDPRKKVVQGVVKGIANGKVGLPMWLGQRAYRFLLLLKRNKWDTAGFTPKAIENCVFTAKLAAAFLALCCHTMCLDLKKNVKSFKRVERLLKSPLASGVFEIPMDIVRNQEKLAESEQSAQVNDRKFLRQSSSSSSAPNKVILASPLCGWGRHVDPLSTENAWRDPRECCLCHLCGDNDAGFPEPEDDDNELTSQTSSKKTEKQSSDKPKAIAESETSSQQSEQEGDADTTEPRSLARLGRLLPMAEGHWVHASCALWSSEVWESPRGGTINAMEKARSRGAQLKCFGCGRPGATVGCNKQNCSFNYHFPCAKVCGAVFTSKQQMFCANHRSNYQSGGTIVRESFEAMKTLTVAPEKQKPVPGVDKDHQGEPKEFCLRIGSLTVHSIGKIVQDADGFHVEDYIYPDGYVATRVFWSMATPRTRTVYILKIERNTITDGTPGPLFTITPGDAPGSKIRGRFVSQVYQTLINKVRKVNADYFSQGDLFSKLPMIRKTRKRFYALNGAQFFGVGLNQIRERLESLPGIESVVAPLKPTSPKYRFCFVKPNIDAIVDLQRKRAAVAAERALENSTGCARTEGSTAVQRSGGSGRITRALVRSVEEEGPEEVGVNVSSSNRRKNVDPEKNKLDKKRHQAKYNKMKSVPMADRLVARRSHIHGWGLFTKLDIKKDDMITEYMGEIVRQAIADKREAAYEISGEGSCYMFRLDLSRIVDATVIGCMARFMNHCCQPNAYAKIITVDTEFGLDKKIAVFANRDIASGEEITYDYKFPVEDGSLRCTCGAPNCIGRMN